MLFSQEVQKLHENIKEYFRYAKFEDSYECFDAEINTKIVSKKLDHFEIDFHDSKAPELIKMMKGASAQAIQNHKRQQQLEDINEKYLDVLAGARQIYALAVRLMAICEKSKDIQKDKDDRKLLEKMKQAMLKYHKIILPEQKEEYADPLSSKEIRNLVKELQDKYEKVDTNPILHKTLVEIRVDLT